MQEKKIERSKNRNETENSNLKKKVLNSLVNNLSNEKDSLFLRYKSYEATGIEEGNEHVNLKMRISLLEDALNNVCSLTKRKVKEKNKSVLLKSAPVEHHSNEIVQAEVKSEELTEKELRIKKIWSEWDVERRVSFKELYEEHLFDFEFFSAFRLLKTRLDSVTEEEGKHELDDFFSSYKQVLKLCAEKDMLLNYANYLSNFMNSANLSESHKESLVYLFPIGAMSLCFSVLVSAGSLNAASVFKPYINNNLDAYPNVLNDLVKNNKIPQLDYLLESTINHNFNNNNLLNILMGLGSYENILYFFKKYNFDINAILTFNNPNVPAPEWNTLWGHIISSKNFELYKDVLNSYDEIPFSVMVKRGNQNSFKRYSIFNFIKDDANINRYIDEALSHKSINNMEINTILELLMPNPQALISCFNSNVIDKIFDHPELRTVSFVEGSTHLFGFLSCVDFWAKNDTSGVIHIYEVLEHILNKFLVRFPDTKSIPIGVNLNLYGTIVFLMGKYSDTRVFNLLFPLLEHYREWVNVENPCGKTPIELVAKDNKKSARLKKVLISLGAVERKGIKWKFWEKNNKSNQVDFSQRENLQYKNDTFRGNDVSLNDNSNSFMENSRVSIEAEMRESFNQIRPSLKNFPLTIRLACEDLFLSAENLLIVAYENENFGEDIFFLIQTFNDYLPSIIAAYQKSMDLNFIKNPDNKSSSENDEKEILKQIEMLSNHVKKLKFNFELKLKKNIDMDILKNTEFLKAKLNVNDSESSKTVNDISEYIQKGQDNKD